MLKAGIKRRRTQQQIKDQKQEETLRQQSIEAKLAQFDQLKQQYNAMKQEADQGKNATQILTNMIQNGEAEMDETGHVHIKPQYIDQSDQSQISQ